MMALIPPRLGFVPPDSCFPPSEIFFQKYLPPKPALVAFGLQSAPLIWRFAPPIHHASSSDRDGIQTVLTLASNMSLIECRDGPSKSFTS
ncbi:hypothetical protein CGZ80_01080 [Rhodopirellula sp. MGV]|nr:hypothetical protein CGZ80_01080 [Rhodopirellula sp. MGV]PNY37653.1 hypothetical protein C2E31_06815 [Rhodopirellula baltica]